MIQCPYCKEISVDFEFCDSCGKVINEIDEVEGSSKELVQYRETTVDCLVVESYLTKEHLFKFDSELIETPFYIEDLSNEKKQRLYFMNNADYQLSSCFNHSDLKFEDVIIIMKRIKMILELIQNKGYILGTVNLSDFWIKYDDLETLYFRQTRPLLKRNEPILSSFIAGDICAPEVLNNDINCIDLTTDVYLFGKLFFELVINQKLNIVEYSYERYVAQYLQLFNSEIPSVFNYWLCKSISIFNEDRYDNLDDCFYDFQSRYDVYQQMNQEKLDDFKLSYAGLSHLGKRKLDLKVTADSTEEEIRRLNEDYFLILEAENKSLLLVADGISTCTLGSGYEASRILGTVVETFWHDNHEDLQDLETASDFILKVVNECNKRIFEAIMDEYLTGYESIMGTTLAIMIQINGICYYCSIGDSLIYLLREGILIPLSLEDNVGNDLLKEGVSWSKYLDNEEKHSLSKYIGGYYSVNNSQGNQPFEIVVEELYLAAEDLILICSDGLTNYLDRSRKREDEWYRDRILKQLLVKMEQQPLELLNHVLVDTANDNGGGDNITVVTLKVNEGGKSVCQ